MKMEGLRKLRLFFFVTDNRESYTLCYEKNLIFKEEMDMSEVTIKDFQKEARRRAFKEKVSSKIQSTKDWVVRNKDAVITLTPVVVGGVTTVVKVVGKYVNQHKQEDLKDLYCYDRSLGHYWKLRRELTNDEWLEIDKRKKNGERLSDILDELKVLK